MWFNNNFAYLIKRSLFITIQARLQNLSDTENKSMKTFQKFQFRTQEPLRRDFNASSE